MSTLRDVDAVVLFAERDRRLRFPPVNWARSVALVPVGREKKPLVAQIVRRIGRSGIGRAVFVLGFEAEEITEVVEATVGHLDYLNSQFQTEHIALRAPWKRSTADVLRYVSGVFRLRQTVLVWPGSIWLDYPLQDLVEIQQLSRFRIVDYAAWSSHKAWPERIRCKTGVACLTREVVERGQDWTPERIELDASWFDAGVSAAYDRLNQFLLAEETA